MEIDQVAFPRVDIKPDVELIVNSAGKFVEAPNNLPNTAPTPKGYTRLCVFTSVGACLLTLGSMIAVDKIQEVIDGTPCNPGPDELALDVGQKNTLKAELDDANARSKYPIRIDKLGISVAGLALAATPEHMLIINEIDAAYRGFSNLDRCEYPSPDGSESDTPGFVIKAKVKEDIDDATLRLDIADQFIEDLNTWAQTQLQPVVA